MTFLDELENKINSAYFEIIKKQLPKLIKNKTLNCSSYSYITKEIRNILVDCNRQGLDVVNTTGIIIYELIKRNYFIYNNIAMSAFIGYQYYKKYSQANNKFSIGNINNTSTINEIIDLVITW